ncbi:M12 family metallo-peptidase [Halomonas denitrificans]|nr:zinc-dependent metalloprotease [Halomonas denitrificans]
MLFDRLPSSNATTLFATLVLVLAHVSEAHATSTFERNAAEHGWHTTVHALPLGASLRLTGVGQSGSNRAPAELELTKLVVVADNASLIIDGGDAVPLRMHRTWLTGRIVGEPGSRVTLAIGRDGATRGLVRGANGLRALVGTAEGGLSMQAAAEDTRRNAFSCGNDASLTPPPLPGEREGTPVLQDVPIEGFTARVALETDHEYYSMFGNVDDAAAYAADLIAFASTIYQAEADTALGLVSLSLWTTGDDPWVQTGASCRLSEFGAYWNENNNDVDRTLAHFLSGANLGGGIAWVGVLCQGAFNTGASCPGMAPSGLYGGDYGVTGNLAGNFDMANPQSVWDIVATSHEIGHNFSSPHTHCYAGIDGNPNDIDQCYGAQAGCYSGPASLPGPAGQGSGTLMSYCHLQSGGMSNIALTLGLDHQYGNAPQRVPDRMLGHVIQRESSFPGCLTTPLTLDGPMLSDGFESGTTD